MPALSTIDLNSPAIQQAMKAAGKKGVHPPMGASPGELRLWLRQNNLLDAASKQADDFEHTKARTRKVQYNVPRGGAAAKKTDYARSASAQRELNSGAQKQDMLSFARNGGGSGSDTKAVPGAAVPGKSGLVRRPSSASRRRPTGSRVPGAGMAKAQPGFR